MSVASRYFEWLMVESLYHTIYFGKKPAFQLPGSPRHPTRPRDACPFVDLVHVLFQTPDPRLVQN